ncbi:MAG: hypothetical protein BGO64_14205 [Aeromonas sp. 62-46]|uniref:hypothetical protein n=1 Tax=Aeromonas sp. 62-46 TaxID=1895698 RepID=UPI00092AD2EB|nr:hypothetical protein [Aeromonas sp. 62-46]OJW67493.1 MAG: hypothetical protein BGO64_14205 [Aeromonas sp. 62-46]
MFAYADALRTSRAQLLAAAIDEGSAGPATLKIYTGGRPAPGAAVTSQVLLVTLQFTHPCAQSVTGGVLTLKPLAEQMVIANGVQSWGRIANRDGGFVADLDVGPPESGADIEIPASELFTGAMVRINDAIFTEP